MADNAPPRVALYRMVQPLSHNHIYTIDLEERQKLLATGKWRNQGILGYVYATQQRDSLPLFRLNHPGNTVHLYTTAPAERDRVIARFGFRSEGIACYVPLASSQGAVTVFHLWHSVWHDRVYTTSTPERRQKVKEGWKFQGTPFAVFVSADPTTVGPGPIVCPPPKPTVGPITDPELWDKIMALLDSDDEHVCVMPMATFIKPVRVINLVQLDTAVTGAKSPCPPGSVNLPKEDFGDLALNISTGGTAVWTLQDAPADSKIGLGPVSALPDEKKTPTWLDVPGAKWVGESVSTPMGDYTFELYFELAPTFKNPQGDITLRADDSATLFLNDQPILETQAGEGAYAADDVAALSIEEFASLLKKGQNSLKVVVRNTGGPCGFAISGTITADQGAPASTDGEKELMMA